jgi:molecular chaperone DnaK (HSP70)
MDNAKTVWGIDLGTTYSCISRVDENGYPVVINNLQGNPITPSVVLFSGPEDVAVGQPAKDEMQLTPDLVCELVKQNMGAADWKFRAHGEDWSAPEVASFILKELASSAAQATGIPVEDVVITVPAYFGVAEREATIAAGKMAGLDVKNILNEPTAAAFSYGFAQSGHSDETVLVYDLGGGTFDVTVIRLEATENGGTGIRVVATGGDDRLGGALWDARMVELLARKFVEAAPDALDPLDDPLASADLRIKAEAIKVGLTNRETHSELILAGTDRAKVTVSREEFETATQDLLQQTIEFTKQTVSAAAAAGAPTIDRVLLVGGSSFMPAVARRLTEEFPDWTPELSDPNQAVAKGAALAGLQQAIWDVIADDGDAAPAADGTPAAPPSPEKVREVAEAMNMTSTMVEKMASTKFTNVCSRAFGVKVLRDDADPGNVRDPEDFFVEHIILPNTPLPLTGAEEGRVRTFYTVSENQDRVNIVIMEQVSREPSPDMDSNKFLEAGVFEMTRPYPAQSPIQMTLGMANSGTLCLRAIDPDGLEREFVATANGAVVSEEQIAASTSKIQAMRTGA